MYYIFMHIEGPDNSVSISFLMLSHAVKTDSPHIHHTYTHTSDCVHRQFTQIVHTQLTQTVHIQYTYSSQKIVHIEFTQTVYKDTTD